MDGVCQRTLLNIPVAPVVNSRPIFGLSNCFAVSMWRDTLNRMRHRSLQIKVRPTSFGVFLPPSCHCCYASIRAPRGANHFARCALVSVARRTSQGSFREELHTQRKPLIGFGRKIPPLSTSWFGTLTDAVTARPADEGFLRLGILLAQSGRTVDARSSLERALEMNPGRVETRAILEQLK